MDGIVWQPPSPGSQSFPDVPILGRDGVRLRVLPLPLPAEVSARARPLELLPTRERPALLPLQERDLRLHPALVPVLQRLQLLDARRSLLLDALSDNLYEVKITFVDFVALLRRLSPGRADLAFNRWSTGLWTKTFRRTYSSSTPFCTGKVATERYVINLFNIPMCRQIRYGMWAVHRSNRVRSTAPYRCSAVANPVLCNAERNILQFLFRLFRTVFCSSPLLTSNRSGLRTVEYAVPVRYEYSTALIRTLYRPSKVQSEEHRTWRSL